MFDAIKTMSDEQLREMIAGIAGAADPWSTDIMALGSDVIDAIGNELFRRCLGQSRQARAS